MEDFPSRDFTFFAGIAFLANRNIGNSFFERRNVVCDHFPTEHKASRKPLKIARNGYKCLGLGADVYKKYFLRNLVQDVFQAYFLRQSLVL